MKTPFSIIRLSATLGRWLRRADHRTASADQFPPHRPPLLVIVEGRHDIEFLRRISAMVHEDQPALPDLQLLERRGQLIFIPAGGGDFRPWLTRLSTLGTAEFHLYDREIPPTTAQRQQWAAQVNLRPRCRAFLTSKRSLENYLHPDAIREAHGVQFTVSDDCDVAELAAMTAFTPQNDGPTWVQLSRRARRRQRDRAKTWLNTTAVSRMTPQRLAQRDPAGDVARWLTVIVELLDSRS